MRSPGDCYEGAIAWAEKIGFSQKTYGVRRVGGDSQRRRRSCAMGRCPVPAHRLLGQESDRLLQNKIAADYWVKRAIAYCKIK